MDERVGLGFGPIVVGNARRAPTHPAVRSNLVVVANDVVQDLLEFNETRRGSLR
jgi:hypothetical protein